MIASPPPHTHTHRSDVLHSSEGQKNEKSGSVVNHCWPWLQVIKALLSFCQSSDSTNISPWLISAVFSVQFIPSPEKINTQPLCSLYTCAFLDIIVLACRLCIITNVSSSLKARNSMSSVQKRVFLRVENLLSHLMGIFWFCRVALQLKLSPFWFSWINYLNTESQPSYIFKLSFVRVSPPLVHPMNEDGHPIVW